ncbi:hypothetical protein LQV05_002711 [Cryptococcus neoformans]|nr:hypothetical protein LQV05_002711 [Cryptococcus neoformans]
MTIRWSGQSDQVQKAETNGPVSGRRRRPRERKDQRPTAISQQLPAVAQKVTRSSARLAARTQPDQPRQKAAIAIHEQVPQSTSTGDDKENISNFIPASTFARHLSVADIRKPNTANLDVPEQGGYDDRGFWRESPSTAEQSIAPQKERKAGKDTAKFRLTDITATSMIDSYKRRHLSLPSSSSSSSAPPPPTDLRTPHLQNLINSKGINGCKDNHFFRSQDYTPPSRVIGGLFRTKSLALPPQSLSHADIFQPLNYIEARQGLMVIPLSSSTQTADTSEVGHQVEELSDEDEQSPVKRPITRRSHVRPVEGKPYIISGDEGEEESQEEEKKEDEGHLQPTQPLNPVPSRSASSPSKWRDPFSYIPAANTQSAAPLRSHRRSQIRPLSTVFNTSSELVAHNTTVDEKPPSQMKFDRIGKTSEVLVGDASTSIVKAMSISGKRTYGKGRSHTYKPGFPDPVPNGQLASITPPAHSPSTHNPSAIGLLKNEGAQNDIRIPESLNKAPDRPAVDLSEEEGEDELWSDDWPGDLGESPTKRGPLRPVTIALGKRSPRKRVAESDSEYNPDVNNYSKKKQRPEFYNKTASSPAQGIPRLRLSRNDSVQIRVQKWVLLGFRYAVDEIISYIQVVQSVRPKRSRRHTSRHIRPPVGYSFKPFDAIPFSKYVKEYRKNPDITLFKMPTGLFSSGCFAKRHASKKVNCKSTRHKTPPVLDPSQNDPHWEDEIVFESSTRPIQPGHKDNGKVEAPIKRIPKLNVVTDPIRHQSKFQLSSGRLPQRKRPQPVDDACRKVPTSDFDTRMDTGHQINTGTKAGHEERLRPIECEKVGSSSLIALQSRRTVMKDTGYWKIPQQDQPAKRINAPKKSVWPVQLQPQESIKQFPSPAFVSVNLPLSISGDSTQERQTPAFQCLNPEDDDLDDRRMMSGIDMANHLVGRLNSHRIQSRKERQETREKRVKEKREALRREEKKGTDAGVDKGVRRPSQKISAPVTPNRSYVIVPSSHARPSDTHSTTRCRRAVATSDLSRVLIRSSTQVRPLSAHPTPSLAGLVRRNTMLPSPSLKKNHSIAELRLVGPQPSNIVVTPSKAFALLTQRNTQHNTRTSSCTPSYPPLAQASRHLGTQYTQVLERTEVDSSRTRPTQNLEKTEMDSSSQPRLTQGLEKTWIGSSRPHFRAFSSEAENEEAHEINDALFSQGTPEVSPSPPPVTQALSRLRSRSIGSRSIGLRAPPSPQKTPVSQRTRSQGTQKSGRAYRVEEVSKMQQ